MGRLAWCWSECSCLALSTWLGGSYLALLADYMFGFWVGLLGVGLNVVLSTCLGGSLLALLADYVFCFWVGLFGVCLNAHALSSRHGLKAHTSLCLACLVLN